jgi:hypothetical protein
VIPRAELIRLLQFFPLGFPVCRDYRKALRMKLTPTSLDSFVEQHYQVFYRAAADLVIDPLAAARVTERAFMTPVI